MGAEDAGVLVNKDSLIQSFGRHYRRCPTAVYFAKSRHNQVNLTSSRLKGNYSCFSVVSVLTFHSHRDDKFFPGCTLATVISPGFSLALSASAACFRHLWQTRKCRCFFSRRQVITKLLRPRTFTSNSPGRRGISREQIASERTWNT